MVHSDLAFEFGAMATRVATILLRVLRRLTSRKRPTTQAAKNKLTLLKKPGIQNRYKGKTTPVATALNDKLWMGFSRYALRELAELEQSASAVREERTAAAWYLARWHASQKKYTRALDYLASMDNLNPSRRPKKRQALLKVECLLRQGCNQEARRILERQLETTGEDPELWIAYANTYVSGEGSQTGCKDEALRLDWINRIYRKAGLLQLVKADAFLSLSIDNLITMQHSSYIEDRNKVSVIMPAYNAGSTIRFALVSLLSQTWKNLEIIVVDDCSSDDTFEIAKSFASPGIVSLRQTSNKGSYSARNRALQIATGDFITVHDADDWSHPQKIELQVSALRNDRSIVGTYSYWCRALSNLRVTGASRPPGLIQANKSSSLYRRSVFQRHGGWDDVRVSADNEFILRIGQRHVGAIMPGVPLSFSLDSPLSLTRDNITHSRTLSYGVRREYHESAAHWRALNLVGTSLKRQSRTYPFPVPGIILPEREIRVDCDVMFIMDFNMGGCAFESSLSFIQSAIAQGSSVALFQWPLYDSDVARPLKFEVRHMAQEGKLRIVAPGEKVCASTVVVCYPPLLQHVVDLCPEVRFDSFFVLTSQREAREYDPHVVRNNLKELFGTEGVWVPEAELHRHLKTPPAFA